MKWMGWSWRDLQGCPEELVPVIVEAMNREIEATRRANRGRGR